MVPYVLMFTVIAMWVKPCGDTKMSFEAVLNLDASYLNGCDLDTN